MFIKKTISFLAVLSFSQLPFMQVNLFGDRHSVVQKTFDDIDDNKLFFEQCENIAALFKSNGVPIAVANVVNEQTNERITINEQGKCVATYNSLGVALPLEKWTYEHIDKAIEVMAQVHNLNLEFPNYISKSENEISKKAKDFSWKNSFYSENDFIKKNIQDTFFIEIIQAQIKENNKKLEVVNYVSDFVSWLPKADDGHENQLTNPQQVLSHRNFSPQNFVWDENSNPWLVGTSHCGFVDPKKEIINFAAVMSGLCHDQQKINWESFFYILTKYSGLNPNVNATNEDVFYQLKNYLFSTKNVKYAFVKLLLELEKPILEQDQEKLKQCAVTIQVGLRSLNDSWNNFDDIYFHLFP